MKEKAAPYELLLKAIGKGLNINYCTYLKDNGEIDRIYIPNSQELTLSELQTWLREEKKLNLWIEHGSTKNGKVTHDITTDKGCLRGGYSTYNEALIKEIEILLNELN